MIAFGKGGALETVRGLGLTDKPTGAFFYEQTPAAIAQAVQQFEQQGQVITSDDCRANAEKFSIENFKRGMTDLVQRALTGAH